ncbi:hypothetical protein [Novosphingobium guangzhouense]|uniref:Uncharacterized protein n=1 Tax=Novosphingobium guangzhouense TaxID=1850347 RepID=A0A2K2G3Y1_9SPHN|nr:hypothetical protein [Novosphingobium guangzhouense]PNU05755.1 hypothetical protein A8V01_14350 [Novosphingobium guangzhouense]
MKVADDNIIRFERMSEGMGDLSARLSAGIVYAAQRKDRGEEHDGRGLTIAILLCMACWAALGYFLLS